MHRMLLVWLGLLGSALANVVPNITDYMVRYTDLQPYRIRYKSPQMCDNSTAYSGYIDLDDDRHMFFWFVAARQNADTAPFTIYFDGGPGFSSMASFFTGNGPCRVEEDLSLSVNPNSWTEHSNMLYLDQPVQTGFSYSTRVNGTLDSDGFVVPANDTNPPTGTFTDGRWHATANSSDEAAEGIYRASQAFLANFPEYQPNSSSLNIWSYSYGGHYAPAAMKYYLYQNDRIKRGKITGVPVKLGSVGIGNGLIDKLNSYASYPAIADNSTVEGFKAYDPATYNQVMDNLWGQGACVDQIQWCRSNMSESRWSDNTHDVCLAASRWCRENVQEVFYTTGYAGFNILLDKGHSNLPSTYYDYCNQQWVQQEIGALVNITHKASPPVERAFSKSSDSMIDFNPVIGGILDKNVRVIMYAGDLDYISNWYGMENDSLAVDYHYQHTFASQQYTELVVERDSNVNALYSDLPVTYNSNTSLAGQIREFRNFAFARVNNAGHFVATEMPQVANTIFYRGINNLDIATGTSQVNTTITDNEDASRTAGAEESSSGHHHHHSSKSSSKSNNNRDSNTSSANSLVPSLRALDGQTTVGLVLLASVALFYLH